jgi:hypothetical protein
LYSARASQGWTICQPTDCPANRTLLDIEGQILAAAEDNPGYGSQRIAQELNRCGKPVDKTAVYNVTQTTWSQ